MESQRRVTYRPSGLTAVSRNKKYLPEAKTGLNGKEKEGTVGREVKRK
jgi:hypothetical protein